MRALYLSLYLMTFFLILSLLTGFAEFSGFDIDSNGISNGNETLNQGNITSNINTLKDDSFDELNSLKTDNTISSFFSLLLYGLKIIFTVIINTIRYLLFFADVLMMWGTPILIASFIQLMIYLSYVMTLIEIFGVKK